MLTVPPIISSYKGYRSLQPVWRVASWLYISMGRDPHHDGQGHFSSIFISNIGSLKFKILKLKISFHPWTAERWQCSGSQDGGHLTLDSQHKLTNPQVTRSLTPGGTNHRQILVLWFTTPICSAVPNLMSSSYSTHLQLVSTYKIGIYTVKH